MGGSRCELGTLSVRACVPPSEPCSAEGYPTTSARIQLASPRSGAQPTQYREQLSINTAPYGGSHKVNLSMLFAKGATLTI